MWKICPTRSSILTLTLLTAALVAACGGSEGSGTSGSVGETNVEVTSMTNGRGQHTATLLPGGNVIITGGYGRDLALAEVYDPALGTWSASGEMGENRYGHTAIVLSSGLLLVVGGDNLWEQAYSLPLKVPLNSSELFDPSTNTWSSAGNMTHAHGVGHTTTMLKDGRILVAGGAKEVPGQIDRERVVVAFSELYDPSTGTWSLTGDMTEPRENHIATLLNDGSVLVTGGSSAEIYDPSTGTWSKTEQLPNDHGIGSTATALKNGKILIAGGGERNLDGSPMAVSYVDIYDQSTGKWSSVSNMAAAELNHTATLLGDGKLLIVGLSSAQIYDPDADTWTLAGDMSENRGSTHAATLLENNTVLITGGSRVERTRYGIETSREVIASAEIYDPAKGW